MVETISSEEVKNLFDSAFHNAREKLIARFPDYETKIAARKDYTEKDLREDLESAWANYRISNPVPEELLELNVQNPVTEALVAVLLLGLYRGSRPLTPYEILPYFTIWEKLKEIWEILTGE